jgi:hypothetical protein
MPLQHLVQQDAVHEPAEPHALMTAGAFGWDAVVACTA